MFELKIKDKKANGLYVLEEKSGKIYEVILEFQTKIQPKIGDVLIMNEALFNPNFQKFSKFYSFGEMNSEFGREILSDLDVDLIGFSNGTEKKVFKRIYG